MSRRVWLWRGPDGVMVFGTAERAKRYVSKLFPEVTDWRTEDGVWCGYESDADEWTYTVCPEKVM